MPRGADFPLCGGGRKHHPKSNVFVARMSLFHRNGSNSTNGIENGRNPAGDLGMAAVGDTLVKQKKLPARLRSPVLQVWAPFFPRL